ncbi:hypothetical protein KFK09_000664 [Dendrobium nobile]|uniref:Uncharacterized protein n=1 Tax=Dendrobium nobile TaxID=94219 RepID=A0A8T3CCI9_DENNO|nr:hypothetical protein KFK09_000664 [Dendrobium nobile]
MQVPMGAKFTELLNEEDRPLKQTDSLLADPQNALQKSVSVCQRSKSLEDEIDFPAKLYKEAANGDFHMDASLQESQTYT